MNIYRILFVLCYAMLCSSTSFAKVVSDKNSKTEISRYKSSGPIEITSDSLEVLQKNNKAVFSGHVVAVQGDVRLKAEKMTVLYTSKEQTSDKSSKKEKSAVSGMSEKNSIEKIIVEKNVLLTTPEETASGANGIYDVVNQKIFLNDNVVLTRDKNVLKGNKLVYDFTTGKSELNSANYTGTGKKKQRVKALFVPDKNNDKMLSPKKQ